MPSYLVSSPHYTDWHEDPVAFAAAFKERWPDADVRETSPDSTMELEFELQEQGEPVLGHLHRDGQAVGMDADVPAAAAIAAWWRTRVPDRVELVFFDEGYNADVPVPPGADGGGVASAYIAAAMQ